MKAGKEKVKGAIPSAGAVGVLLPWGSGLRRKCVGQHVQLSAGAKTSDFIRPSPSFVPIMATSS